MCVYVCLCAQLERDCKFNCDTSSMAGVLSSRDLLVGARLGLKAMGCPSSGIPGPWLCMCVCVSIPLHDLLLSACLTSFVIDLSMCMWELKGLQRARSLSGYRDREVNSRSTEGQISRH